MTTPLLASLPTPTAPLALADDRVTCESCGESFPPAGVEFYEPRQEWLCLDHVDGELLDAEDRRAFFNYRHGR